MTRLFWIEWIVANIVGFTVGNLFGNGNYGLVTGFKGDILSGAIFGTAQAFILSRQIRVGFRRTFLFWVSATASGFMIGVFIGRRITLQLVNSDQLILIGLIFGVIVGVVVTVLQWIILRWGLIRTSVANWWLPASMTAWIVGEIAAMIIGNVPAFIPIFGAIFAVITGIFWQWRIRPHL